MVTSYIAHSASKAADSSFLWLSVSRWETRDKHVGETAGGWGVREAAVAGLFLVLRQC